MAPRVWLISGASTGLGLELAKIAASRGDRVIAASRSPEKIANLAGITSVRLDHNESLSQVQTAIKDIINIHGTVDIVVNNAAYVQTGTVEETTPEDTFRQFQANTFGPINVYRSILPHMRQKRSGTLVTIGSMAAWYPMPSCNMYNASKAALRWLTIGMADEVKQFGIQHVSSHYFCIESCSIILLENDDKITRRLPNHLDRVMTDIIVHSALLNPASSERSCLNLAAT